MTQPEFLGWVEFFKLHPFDDYSRYYRPAALVASSMTGAEPSELLDWLERRPSPKAKYSDVDLSMMQAFGLKPPRKE
jgi:hypothetical protein